MLGWAALLLQPLVMFGWGPPLLLRLVVLSWVVLLRLCLVVLCLGCTPAQTPCRVAITYQ